MTKNERRFYRSVKENWTPLVSIQKKMGLSYQSAWEFAEYLRGHNLIRVYEMSSNVSPTGYIYLVAKPLKSDKSIFWEWVEHISKILGILVTILGLVKWRTVLNIFQDLYEKLF